MVVLFSMEALMEHVYIKKVYLSCIWLILLWKNGPYLVLHVRRNVLWGVWAYPKVSGLKEIHFYDLKATLLFTFSRSIHGLRLYIIKEWNHIWTSMLMDKLHSLTWNCISSIQDAWCSQGFFFPTDKHLACISFINTWYYFNCVYENSESRGRKPSLLLTSTTRSLSSSCLFCI